MNIEKEKFTNEELLAFLPSFTDKYAEVNGIKLHYVRGGSGAPLILLPGWPLTWWSYHKIMEELAGSFDVIVIDFRGMGNSDKPLDGYDKKTIAGDISLLADKLNLGKVNIAGHDIGAMVAFSFAANHPDQTAKLILIDSLHPEESMYQLTLIPSFGAFDGENLNPETPYLWWWSFLQVKSLANQLLEGRVHLLHNWFFENTLVDKASISEFDRSVYHAANENSDSIRSGNAWFQAFAQDIEDQKVYAPLEIPVLGIGAALYNWMEAVLPGKTTNLKMVKAENSAHYPVDEEPVATAKFITDFLNTQA